MIFWNISRLNLRLDCIQVSIQRQSYVWCPRWQSVWLFKRSRLRNQSDSLQEGRDQIFLTCFGCRCGKYRPLTFMLVYFYDYLTLMSKFHCLSAWITNKQIQSDSSTLQSIGSARLCCCFYTYSNTSAGMQSVTRLYPACVWVQTKLYKLQLVVSS